GRLRCAAPLLGGVLVRRRDVIGVGEVRIAAATQATVGMLLDADEVTHQALDVEVAQRRTLPVSRGQRAQQEVEVLRGTTESLDRRDRLDREHRTARLALLDSGRQ